MSEAPAEVVIESPQIKRDLIDPRTISQNKDQEGRDKLASDIRESRLIKDEVKKTEAELDERQENTLAKIKNKLHIPDKQTVELQGQLLEQRTKQDKLPDSKKMVEAYYEKVAETPLTNQEKRDLLKPEVLSQLTADEYIALWKRLNPHFLTHVTRQGFRDHNAMVYHSAGLREFHDGFVKVARDKMQLRPPLALAGLRGRDEISVKMFLSSWVLQAESEDEAKERFDDLLHWTLASAPAYPDKVAVHFAAQIAASDYYGGENENEVFFVFPSDVLAAQHNFAFNGWEKDFTHPQSERQWNDVFVWPNSVENPGISIDSGMVFLPEKTQVDSNTGSKYASEVKIIDGKEQRVMIEDPELIKKFMEWAKKITDESPVVKAAHRFYKGGDPELAGTRRADVDSLCFQELQQLGFDEDSAYALLPSLVSRLTIWNKDSKIEWFQALIDESSAKFKKAESTVPAKDYWENFFSKNPDLRPKHVVYYGGSPTSAIYRFQQENGIGHADTSKTDGPLLGFDDRHVVNVKGDPRSNLGHQELIDLGGKIIANHYQNSIG